MLKGDKMESNQLLLKIFILGLGLLAILFVREIISPSCENLEKVKESFLAELDRPEYDSLVYLLKSAKCGFNDSVTFSLLALNNAKSFFIRENTCNVRFDKGKESSLGKILSHLDVLTIKHSKNLTRISFNRLKYEPKCAQQYHLYYSKIPIDHLIKVKDAWYISSSNYGSN